MTTTTTTQTVPSPPIWQRIWTQSGLSKDVLIAMFKNALPSTAALWIIQSATVGQKFNSVGFLPIVVTILMTPNLPRIPYLRMLIYTLFLQSIVLCVSLLAGYSITQARRHTTPAGASLSDYNSSASAVAGIWIIATIWCLQTLRTYKPVWAKPVVLSSIFSTVAMLSMSRLEDMSSIISFNIQLLEMFLLGYGFSTISSLFVFPQGSRTVSDGDIATMFKLSQKVLSPERPFGTIVAPDQEDTPLSTAQGHLVALTRAFAKLEIDVSDAKRDVGWSYLSTGDYKRMTGLFRNLIDCLRGLFAVESIRTTLHFGSRASYFDAENALEEPSGLDESKKHWDAVFEKLQSPVARLCGLSEDAIEHCCLLMDLSKPSAARAGVDRSSNNNDNSNNQMDESDSEKSAQTLPGGTQFVEHLRSQMQQQRDTLRLVLAYLQEQDGPLGSTTQVDQEKPFHKRHVPNASQGRLLFKLYIEYLHHGILEALLELVMFCETNFRQSKSRLQVPGKKRMLKVIRSVIEHHHPEGDLDDIESEIPSLSIQRTPTVKSEHLVRGAGMSMYRQVVSYLERSYSIFGSSQSFFAIRVASAIMSVAIVAYLHPTQQWFFNRRGIWAAIFIPFSMAPSSGEAKAMLLHRVLGTAFSIVTSLVNWYIVNGHPAGVIVFYFIAASIMQYFLIRHPQWGTFWRPCIITHSIIVGYSLQDVFRTVPQPPATNTDRYPIYLIAPYRALCTLIGVAIAYVWTVFPIPTTANSVMRRRLGQALFVLGDYHNCMHWAISSWAGGQAGDVHHKGSMAHRLSKTRHKLFVHETALLTIIRNQHNFAAWDFSLRGARPEHRYVLMADEVDSIVSYFNVIIFVATHFQTRIKNSPSAVTGPWESGIDDLVAVCQQSTRHIAVLIHMLASSVTNDQPLPPFLVSPKPFAVAKNLRELRPDLMDARHAQDEGYKAFAVIEVSVAMVTKSLDRLLGLVREMVGEISSVNVTP